MTKLSILFLLVVASFIYGGAALAQGQHSGAKHSMAKMYACEKCEMASMKPGNCKGCKMAMKQIHGTVAYSCEHCKTMSAKMGKCPKCNMDMKKMAMTFACDHCHTTSTKTGKCPMCMMPMKEHKMKMG